MERTRSDINSGSLLLMNHYQMAGTDRSTPTHVSMDGSLRGKFNLSSDKEGEFLESLGNDVNKNMNLYFCEMATPISALFFDFDFESVAVVA